MSIKTDWFYLTDVISRFTATATHALKVICEILTVSTSLVCKEEQDSSGDINWLNKSHE